MIKTIIAKLFVLSLSGCIMMGSAPKENYEFTQTSKIQDYKGIYRNLGDPESLYLSELLWKDRVLSSHTDPYVKNIRGVLTQERYIIDNSGNKISDKDIELVEVLSVGASITVNAIKNQCIVSSKEYVAGRDFILDEGKILLNQETHLLTRGGGDPILGPSYEKVELGLDTKGNGKYKSQTYFAGMVLMLVPLAGGGADEVKFEKINSNVKFELCK